MLSCRPYSVNLVVFCSNFKQHLSHKSACATESSGADSRAKLPHGRLNRRGGSQSATAPLLCVYARLLVPGCGRLASEGSGLWNPAPRTDGRSCTKRTGRGCSRVEGIGGRLCGAAQAPSNHDASRHFTNRQYTRTGNKAQVMKSCAGNAQGFRAEGVLALAETLTGAFGPMPPS